MRDRLVSLTESLVRIPTVNPPGENYTDFVSHMEKYCRKLGLKTQKILVPEDICLKNGLNPDYPRVNLVCDWDLGREKTLHFCSHFDVVPAQGSWKTNPFQAVEKKGKLYGRGTYDQKGNIAAILMALENVMRSGNLPKVNIQLSFVCDEEIGGALGTGYLLKNGFLKADYVIGEGSYGNLLTVGSRGILWADVTVFGKSSHAAMPWLGDNAFEKAVHVAGELQNLAGKVGKRKTSFGTEEERARKASFVMGGLVSGGSKVNMVPDKITFTIDRRINPEEDISVAKKEIDDVLDLCREKGIVIKRSFTQEYRPQFLREDDPFVRKIKALIAKRHGPVKLIISPGAGDQRYFIERGISAVGYGVSGGNMHGDDEYLDIESLVAVEKVFEELIQGID